MNKLLLTLLVSPLVLTGCQTLKPETVQVPVTVPCKVEDPLQPTYRFTAPYPDVFSGVRDLLGDRETSLAYEIELRAALKACK